MAWGVHKLILCSMTTMDGLFRGMPGGMPGARRSTKSRCPTSTPLEITRPLKVSLEDLHSGTVKHLKVSRRLLDGTTEDKVLDI